MRNLAIIIARGGSKRIPGKNLRNFLGKPIILYSIEAALSAGCFDEVMVSTDSEEIAAIAKSAGAKVPFMRSEQTSGDFATTVDVISEVVKEYTKSGRRFDLFCCLYPTAPFVTSAKLAAALKKLNSTGADSVVPVTSFTYPIYRALKLDNDRLQFRWPEFTNTRSQDLPIAYHDCGQFYFMRTDKFLEKKRIITDFTVPFIINPSEVQDIDNEDDWKLAELKYKLMKQ